MKKVTRKEIIDACIGILENKGFRSQRSISKWKDGKGFGWDIDTKKFKGVFNFKMETGTINVVIYTGDAYGCVWNYEVPSNSTTNEVAETFKRNYQEYLMKVGALN